MFKFLNKKRILGVIALLASLVWLAVFSFPDQKLYLTFCDVGQGDAILISQGFNQVLIDGGPNDKVLACLARNMPFWDRTIEVIALTHPEADHLTGIISVLDKYRVAYFLTGPEENETANYTALLKKIKTQKTIKIVNPYTGDRLKVGEVRLKALWPEKNWAVLGAATEHKKLNDFSLVFLLQYQNFQALLMGDADKIVQDDMAAAGSLGRVDLLKFPHHGSKTGMAESFLAKIKPKEAVISVGRNSYGHPTIEALELLKKYKVKVRRTDLEGEIRYRF